jgi:hypothetical protein
LYSWTALEAVIPPKKKASAPLDLTLRGQRAVVGRIDVDPVVADDLDAVLFRCVGRGLGDAGGVNLLVIRGVQLLDAQLLHPRALDGALDVVRRHDTRVRALAGRVVLARRALAARSRVLGQLERRVRRADLHQAGLSTNRGSRRWMNKLVGSAARRRAVLVAVVLLAMTGCGGGGDDGGANGTQGASGKRGGTLTVLNVAGGVDSLDPAYRYYQADYQELFDDGPALALRLEAERHEADP